MQAIGLDQQLIIRYDDIDPAGPVGQDFPHLRQASSGDDHIGQVQVFRGLHFRLPSGQAVAVGRYEPQLALLKLTEDSHQDSPRLRGGNGKHRLPDHGLQEIGGKAELAILHQFRKSGVFLGIHGVQLELGLSGTDRRYPPFIHFPLHFIIGQFADQFPDDPSGEYGITHSFQTNNFLILFAQGHLHPNGHIGVAAGKDDAFFVGLHFDPRQDGDGGPRRDRLGYLGNRIHQSGSEHAKLHGKSSSLPDFFEISKRWRAHLKKRGTVIFLGVYS